VTLTTGIERLRIRNYRVLRDVELDGLTPVTALLGPNGSGKSTVFDAVLFVCEAVGSGLAAAWRRRGGLEEIRSRGAEGPVEIELGCRIREDLFTYRLAVEEQDGTPVVAEERLTWTGAGQTDGLDLLELNHRSGTVRRPGFAEPVELTGDGVLGVSTFGQLKPNRHIAKFAFEFVEKIQLSDVDVDRMRSGARGPMRSASLDPAGDNIAMRVHYLREEHPETWTEIVRSLRRYVPGLGDILPMRLGDGSYIVRLREKEDERPILPENISDGTVKLLGYLVALLDPASVLLLEEPENQVHPNLPHLLADDLRAHAVSGQVLVATHSPYFVDALQPDEVWTLFRDESGSAKARRAADIPQLMAMVDAGGQLGSLWTEGFFDLGDPLVRSGRPR
jgi:predicted ATPase